MYRDFRDRNEVFSGVLARYAASLTMLHENRSERVRGELVSGNYFQVLGLQASHGRVIQPADEGAPGGSPVAVLGHGFWTRRFGSNAGIVGRTIRLNGFPVTVVGVAPAGFNGTDVGTQPDLFVPVSMKAQMTPTYDGLQERRYMWLNLMARLGDGVSREQAEAGMAVLFRQIRAQELESMKAPSERFRKRFLEARLEVLPGFKGLSQFREQFSTPVIVLMAMVGLVLLIACGNVANLLMARAPGRQREVAIRQALGASHGRIVGQLLVESLVLAIAGGALGVLVAIWTGDLLLRALPFESAARVFTSTPDARVLLFALGVSMLTGLLFGLVPAWQTARPRIVRSLKEEGGSVVGRGHVRLRKGLVVAQVALSLLLLVGAGLFARSLWNLRALDPGFEMDRLVTFSVDPALSGYKSPQTLAFLQQLQERLSSLPGVKSASLAAFPPLSENVWMATVQVEGYKAKEGEDMNPHVNTVGPDYFETMGIPIVAGRGFTAADGPTAPKVAVISEKMAKYFYGDLNPLGRRFGFGRGKAIDIEIVGVVKDWKDQNLKEDVARFVYTPYQQDPEVGGMTFFVRAASDGSVTGDLLRQTVRGLDPAIPVFDVKTMEAVAGESLFFDRMMATLSACFGALATLLAAVGLYGVMSYAVARRTREIGVRVALGAEPGRVVWLVMREVVLLAAIGIGVGLPLALAVGRFMRSQFFGVSPTDPLTLVVATVTLLTVALAAGYVPAGQATRVDPMRALRAE
jgi:predicted permease